MTIKLTFEEIDPLISSGQFKLASEHLIALINTAGISNSYRNEAYSKLINIFVATSKHDLAVEQAVILEKNLNFKIINFKILRFLCAIIFRFVPLNSRYFRKSFEFLSYFIAPRNNENSWNIYRSLQFAYSWHSIERCPNYSILQIANSKNGSEFYRSAAWLAYSFVYSTGSKSSTAVFVRILQETQLRKMDDVSSEIHPLLAIAFFQRRDLSKAIESFKEYRRTYKSVPEFYQLLGYTVEISAKMMMGDLIGAKSAIEQTSRYSISLGSSRHFIHCFGTKAMFAALEGKKIDSIRYIESARRICDENNNNLDRITYFRFESLTYYLNGDYDAALQSMMKQRFYFKKYGYTCHEQNVSLLLKSFISNKTSNFWLRWFNLISSFSVIIFSSRKNLLIYNLRQLSKIIFDRDANFFEERNISNYLRWNARNFYESSSESFFAKLVEQVSKTLLIPETLSGDVELNDDKLQQILFNCLEPNQVIFATSHLEMFNKLEAEQRLDGLNNFDNSEQVMRLSCKNETILLSIRLPTTSLYQDSKVVGIILPSLTLSTLPVIESAFKLILTHFVSKKSLLTAQNYEINTRELIAIARTTQMVAHDVKKPFNMINTLLKIMARIQNMTEMRSLVDQSLPQIQKNIASVNSMLSDIVGISSTEQLSLSKVEISDLLLDSLTECFNFSDDTSVGIQVEIYVRHLLNIDKFKCSRVLSNILTNAVLAMSNVGQINIVAVESVNDGKKFVIISIQNSGKLISESEQERIFDAFYTKGNYKGTGLGLAIAKKIVNAHGGRIWCESTLEAGTSFFIELPISEELATKKSETRVNMKCSDFSLWGRA